LRDPTGETGGRGQGLAHCTQAGQDRGDAWMGAHGYSSLGQVRHHGGQGAEGGGQQHRRLSIGQGGLHKSAHLRQGVRARWKNQAWIAAHGIHADGIRPPDLAGLDASHQRLWTESTHVEEMAVIVFAQQSRGSWQVTRGNGLDAVIAKVEGAAERRGQSARAQPFSGIAEQAQGLFGGDDLPAASPRAEQYGRAPWRQGAGVGKEDEVAGKPCGVTRDVRARKTNSSAVDKRARRAT
jgi:hypothetical protein